MYTSIELRSTSRPFKILLDSKGSCVSTMTRSPRNALNCFWVSKTSSAPGLARITSCLSRILNSSSTSPRASKITPAMVDKAAVSILGKASISTGFSISRARVCSSWIPRRATSGLVSSFLNKEILGSCCFRGLCGSSSGSSGSLVAHLVSSRILYSSCSSSVSLWYKISSGSADTSSGLGSFGSW